MRSSNWDEGLNFHLRMMVQMMAAPPTDAAMTMRTVSVVRFVVDVAPLFAAEEAVGETAAFEVLVTVTRAGAAVVGSGAAVRLSDSEVEEGAAEDDDFDADDEDSEALELAETEAERLADALAVVEVPLAAGLGLAAPPAALEVAAGSLGVVAEGTAVVALVLETEAAGVAGVLGSSSTPTRGGRSAGARFEPPFEAPVLTLDWRFLIKRLS
jgi:hypothetical protein